MFRMKGLLVPYRRSGFLIAILLLFGSFSATVAAPAEHCIKPGVNKGAVQGEFKGWLKNVCDYRVSVVYGFDKKFDGTPKASPWCRNDGDYGNEHPVEDTGQIYEPGERKGIGAQFERGVAFDVGWAACDIDTSANNTVNFLTETPIFEFEANCKYRCR